MGIAVADNTSFTEPRLNRGEDGSSFCTGTGCGLCGTSWPSGFCGRSRTGDGREPALVGLLVGDDSRERKSEDERGERARGELEGDRVLR